MDLIFLTITVFAATVIAALLLYVIFVNARSVIPMAGGIGVENEEIEDERVPGPSKSLIDSKMGTKKRAKLEAKAEKKSQREAGLKILDELKKKKEQEEEKRKEMEKLEREEEERVETAERKAREEKLQKEKEEYEQMKVAFSIEEEGFDEEAAENEENLLEKFIAYIKEKKVVILEDIAGEFRLKVQSVIDRIEKLQADGTLTGVIDDRGKFIYITKEELQAVADFVKKRGRVTIQELVENSNQLITLN